MPELLIKTSETRPDPILQDKDPIHACCDMRINTVHIQHICHMDLIYGPTPELNVALSTIYPYIAIPDNVPYRSNLDGLRHSGTIAEIYLSATRNFKAERVNRDEIIITDLRSLEEKLKSYIPDRQGASTLEQHLYGNGRGNAGIATVERHKVFGIKGNEIWYFGNERWSFPMFSDMWDAIESRCICRRIDYTKMLWKAPVYKKYLVITVDDFTFAEADEIEDSVLDEETNEVLKARKHEVDWRNLPGITGKIIDDVNAKDATVDIRDDFLFTRSSIIETKTLAVN